MYGGCSTRRKTRNVEKYDDVKTSPCLSWHGVHPFPRRTVSFAMDSKAERPDGKEKDSGKRSSIIISQADLSGALEVKGQHWSGEKFSFLRIGSLRGWH